MSGPGSFGARPLTNMRRQYMLLGPSILPKSWRRRWMIARIVATPPWFDSKEVRAIYREAARLTRETGITHEVDHAIPLQHPLVCGLHWHANLQILTQAQNTAKGNKFTIDQMELAL